MKIPNSTIGNMYLSIHIWYMMYYRWCGLEDHCYLDYYNLDLDAPSHFVKYFDFVCVNFGLSSVCRCNLCGVFLIWFRWISDPHCAGNAGYFQIPWLLRDSNILMGYWGLKTPVGNVEFCCYGTHHAHLSAFHSNEQNHTHTKLCQ